MPTKTQVDAAVAQQYYGDPAVNSGWDDITTSLIGRRLNSVVGTVNYNYAENSVTFSPNGDVTDTDDTIVFNIQKPHRMQDTGVFKFHVHWWQAFDGVISPTFSFRYRIQSNGAAKTTAWTTVGVTSSVSNEVFARPTGAGEVINQITRLADIDLSAAGLSATVQFQFTRSDANAGDIDVTFLDAHYPSDQERGSRQEYVK